jgi:hypothetical protein
MVATIALLHIKRREMKKVIEKCTEYNIWTKKFEVTGDWKKTA